MKWLKEKIYILYNIMGKYDSMFDKMKKIMYDDNVFNNYQKEDVIDECVHDFICTNVKICQKCGIFESLAFVDDVEKEFKIKAGTNPRKISQANKTSYKKYVIDQFFGISNKSQPPLIFEDRPYTLNEIISLCRKNKASPKDKYFYFYIANKIKNEKTNANERLLKDIMTDLLPLGKGNMNKICFYIYFLKLKMEEIANLIIPVLSAKNKALVKLALK